jgi:hypothetical protein
MSRECLPFGANGSHYAGRDKNVGRLILFLFPVFGPNTSRNIPAIQIVDNSAVNRCAI